MLHTFSLPCACCPITICSSGMHTHAMGSMLAPLTPPRKLQQLSFNMSSISRGLRKTAHGFFQLCSHRLCLAWVYQSGISNITAPFCDSKQTHVFSLSLLPGLKGEMMILQQEAPNSTIFMLTPASCHQLHGCRLNAALFIREMSPAA